MYLQRKVALNGVGLDDIDTPIGGQNPVVITSVEVANGKEDITAVNSGSGYGQRITANRRSTLDVVVKFRLNLKSKTAERMKERATWIEKINAWAYNGGYLTINYKPNRRLYVTLVQGPGEGSLWDYTKEFELTFRAYQIPYWEESTASAAVTGTSTNGQIGGTVSGSVKTQVNMRLKNVSGALINTANIYAGPASTTIGMSFTDLGLAANETLVVDHSDDGLVRIQILAADGTTYRSAMFKRTTASKDDFWVSPGENWFKFVTPRACILTAQWRGRYL